jgi:hypothetical protein
MPKTLTDHRPWTPAEEAAYWRRIKHSSGNRDAAAIVAACGELLARMDKFLETHDSDCRCDACCLPDEDGECIGDRQAEIIRVAAWTLGLLRNQMSCEVVMPEDLKLFDPDGDPAAEPLVAGGR